MVVKLMIWMAKRMKIPLNGYSYLEVHRNVENTQLWTEDNFQSDLDLVGHRIQLTSSIYVVKKRFDQPYRYQNSILGNCVCSSMRSALGASKKTSNFWKIYQNHSRIRSLDQEKIVGGHIKKWEWNIGLWWMNKHIYQEWNFDINEIIQTTFFTLAIDDVD